MNDASARRILLPAAFAVALLAVHLLAFWPGIMVWDAIRQYGQALSGHYDDWHPPAMNWLWRQLLAFGEGPAPMLVLQALLYWGGLGLIAAKALRGGKRGLAFAIVAIALMPIPLVLVGTVLKDSLMAGALLLATGLIGWRRDGDRWIACIVALLLLGAATLRFNAMPACLPLALCLLPDRWRRSLPRQALAAVIAVAMLLAAMPLANRLLHAEKSGVELSLVIFDLAGTGYHAHADLFPPLGVPDAQTVNAHCYTPIAWDDYAWWVDRPCPIQFAAVRDWFAHEHRSPNLWWASSIARHPIAYAEHRFSHYNQNTRLIVDERNLHQLSLASDPNRWGFTVPPNRLRDIIATLAEASLSTPLGWPLVWMALALAVLIAAPRERSLARPLAWSALLYGLSYLPLSVATEVRYHFWTTTAAALAFAMAAPSIVRARAYAAFAPLLIILTIGIVARL